MAKGREGGRSSLLFIFVMMLVRSAWDRLEKLVIVSCACNLVIEVVGKYLNNCNSE